MPRFDWLRHAAVRGCLIASLLAAVPALSQEENPANHPVAEQADKAKQQPATETPPIAADREQPPKTDWGKPHCAEPQNHDEADLCEQRRVAKAAERTLVANYIQIALGVAGAALLFWTLYYTYRATGAAIVAAEAAAKSANTAELALIALEAPFVYVRIIRPGITIKTEPGARQIDFGSAGAFVLANYGRTPAQIISYYQ